MCKSLFKMYLKEKAPFKYESEHVGLISLFYAAHVSCV